jgi:hypothetical protein
MTDTRSALDSLRVALVPDADRTVTLSPALPALLAPGRVWADVLNSSVLPVTGAALEGEAGGLLEITGTLDVLAGPEPVTVRLFNPAGSQDPDEVECVVIWDRPLDGWTPAAAYLMPASTEAPDTPSQILLRELRFDGAQRFFSSFDFTKNPDAARATGLLPAWLEGQAPAAGLTVAGTLHLPDAVKGIVAPLIGSAGPVTVVANIDVAVNDLRLTLAHRFDIGAPPSIAPFGGTGPKASLSEIEYSFPIDGWALGQAQARLTGALVDGEVGVDISLGIDLVRFEAGLSARHTAGRSAPSLGWALSTLGIPGGMPELPFGIADITLESVNGIFDLRGKALTSYGAEFATSKPVAPFGDAVPLEIDPIVTITVQPGATPTTDVMLSGLWTLGKGGGSVIETMIDVASGNLSAQLQEGSSLEPPDWLLDMLPDSVKTDLKIVDLEISGNHKTGAFTLELETLGTLGLVIEGRTFGVSNVGFEVAHDADGSVISGEGGLVIFDSLVRLSLTVDAGAVPLSFSLASLNLSDLAEVFLIALGTNADLGDLALRDLVLAIEHPTGNFRVDGALASPIRLGSAAGWEIDEAEFTACRSGPGSTGLTAGLTGVITLAGTAIALSADYADAHTRFKGRTDPAAEMDFTQLVSEVFGKFGFAMPAQIPDFKLKNLALEYSSATGDFAFSGDSTVATKIKLGNLEHQIDTRLDLKVGTGADGKRTYAGFLRGELKLGIAKFQVEYDFGDASILKGCWDGTGGALQFSDLAESHGIEHSLQPPGGMPLDLKSAAFELDVSKGKFTLSATSKYGDAFFIASDANGQWDFAFGVLVQFSDIPGFPPLGPLNLKDAVLILSTVRDDKFAVPSLPNAPPPAGQPITAGHAFPALTAARPMRLSPGVSVAASLSFEDSSDPVLGHLGDLVGTSELLIQASFDTTAHSASFLSYLNGSLTIAGSGSEKLVLSNVFIKLEANPLAVLISGSVLIPFDHVTLEAAGALAVSENEMQALFQIKAQADGKPAALPSPFGLRGVELDELDVEVGVIFEPPGVDLGIEGKFNIGGQPPGANEFIVVLELEGEVPNPIYLSTHIQTLSIKEIVTVYTGGGVSQVPPILEALKAEDLSIYWSETAGIVLPDGRVSQQGFGFNGILTIGGFSAHAALAVGATGVSGDAELPPIDWGVFTLKGNGKGVTVKQLLVDGGWQTVARPPEPPAQGPAPQTRDEQIIAPGGATIAINSTHSPFIDIDATVTLFDLISAEVEIEVADTGLKYKQKEDVGGVFHAEFDCAVSASGFSAHSEFDLDIKGEVGPIEMLGIDLGTLSLDVGFHTRLNIVVDGSGFTLGVAGSFEFEGLSLTMPDLAIKDSFKSFDELPGRILQQIKDNAEHIFADLFDAAGKLAEAAEKEVKAIASAVADEAKAIAAGAEDAARQVGAAAEATVAAVGQDVEEAAAAAEQIDAQAEQALADTKAELGEIAVQVGAEIADLANQAAAVAQEAEHEVEAIASAVADEAKAIAGQAEQVWNDAVAGAEQIGRDAEAAAEAAVAAAEAAGEAIVGAAHAVADAMEHEAEAIGNAIDDAARKAASWAEGAAGSIASACSKY